MDVDQVFHLVGEVGPQQILYFIYTAILGGLFVSGEMLQIVFTGAAPEFQCWNGSTPSTSGCDANNRCEHPHYTSRFTSIATEWNLICHDEYFGEDGASRLHGRRHDWRLCVWLHLRQVWTPTHAAICGHCHFAVALVTFVLMTELVGPSKRALLGTLFPGVFALGIGLHAALAYFIPDWRHYTIATAVLSALFVPLALLLPESPRWLLLHGQRPQARQVLLDIAVRNGRAHCLPRTWDLQEPKVHHKGTNPMALFTSSTLRIRTLIQILLWLVNGITYYALTMAASSLGGDLYMSTALSGMIEIPGYLLSAVLLSYIGRRHSLCAVMLIGSVASVALQFSGHFQYSTAVRDVVSLSAKMCISMSFAIIYVYSAELMPTIVRNVGMGIVSVAARVGGIISPFVSLLDNVIPGLQFTVLGIIMLVSGTICPRTSGDRRPTLARDHRGNRGRRQASSEDELYSVHQRPTVTYGS
ncbi:hypothetical protein MTO96_006011 [Rhipicephalus appendiculatus]